MAKRFIDTSYYKSPFVRGLKGSLKGLYLFIICDCDGAGIWVADFEIASMYIGEKVTKDEFEQHFVKQKKAIDLKNGKYFFPDFLEHQYPKGLSNHNPAQKNFIAELQKYSLISTDLKPLWSTYEGTNVMVMETVEVMVEEKETVKKPKIQKVEIIKEVFLTDEENQKAKDFFLTMYENAIETLSNYKLSSGKKYKSDYHALMGWVKDKLKKEINGTKANNNQQSGYNPAELNEVYRQFKEHNSNR